MPTAVKLTSPLTPGPSGPTKHNFTADEELAAQARACAKEKGVSFGRFVRLAVLESILEEGRREAEAQAQNRAK